MSFDWVPMSFIHILGPPFSLVEQFKIESIAVHIFLAQKKPLRNEKKTKDVDSFIRSYSHLKI